MTTSPDQAVAADQLRVSVEMGDDYTPGPRVAKALDELADSLQADDDVTGYNFAEVEINYRSWGFDSLGMGGKVLRFGDDKPTEGTF